MILARLIGKADFPISKVLAGLGYGLMLYLANFFHSLGHILSGMIAGKPMDANVLTATFNVNLYIGDQKDYPERATWAGLGGQMWLSFAGINLLSGVMTLLPIPPLDDWVISRLARGKSLE